MSSIGTAMAATMAKWRGEHGQTATVSRNTPASDGQGGETDSWASAGTVVGFLGPLGSSAQEREIASRFAGVTLYGFGCPPGSSIGAEDRLAIGSSTYEVVGTLQSSLGGTMLAICSLVG